MVGASEPYGLLNANFSDVRNHEFLQRISSLQTAFQEDTGHKLIFHPQTGLCVQRKANMGPLQLGSCADSDVWIYMPRKTLVIEGTYFCLQATGIVCTDSNLRWYAISA
ncbi:hypothetical protein SAY87_016113 [Trapa incisa]|uniref:Uncharacterized protein n=1 Tax=Trapa incisa TaxID=236973 RepID=A0AAN7LGP0_9MYRT|nr:hypothetical protein SAY87_016113 [Trapa incisa]